MSETEQKLISFSFEGKGKAWKAFTSPFSSLLQEVSIRFTDDQLYAAEMDPSHVILAKVYWPKNKFSKFDLNLQGKTYQDYSFNFDSLSSTFRRFADDADVTLSSNIEKNSIIITDGKKRFELIILQETHGSSKIPNIEYTSKVEISISVLKEMMEDCKVVEADAAKFLHENGKLVFLGKDYTGNARGTLVDQFTEELEDTQYTFEYLQPFLNSIDKFAGDKIQMEIKSRKPLHLIVEVENMGTIEYYQGAKSVSG